MEERPIIMGAESVRAILEERKTQTRRVVKDSFLFRFDDYPRFWGQDEYLKKRMIKEGPFQVGDRLYVKEAWAKCPDGGHLYRADPMFIGCEKGDFAWDWKSPLFMPREASRITLEITDIRVEMVQDITEEGAKAEGIKVLPLQDESDPSAWYQYAPGIFQARSAIKSYELLWDSLNAKRGYPWESNPWVWVVSFKVVQGC